MQRLFNLSCENRYFASAPEWVIPLDRGQSVERCLAASLVVCAFDPGDDGDAQFDERHHYARAHFVPVPVEDEARFLARLSHGWSVLTRRSGSAA